jgi:hypothetical protein
LLSEWERSSGLSITQVKSALSFGFRKPPNILCRLPAMTGDVSRSEVITTVLASERDGYDVLNLPLFVAQDFILAYMTDAFVVNE